MVQADVLQHAYRDKCVVLSLHITVIVVNELDTLGYPFTRRALPRVRQLLARYVERFHMDPILARHVERERSPAASCFDHGLTRLQAELAADDVELRGLSGLERHL